MQRVQATTKKIKPFVFHRLLHNAQGHRLFFFVDLFSSSRHFAFFVVRTFDSDKNASVFRSYLSQLVELSEAVETWKRGENLLLKTC
jgi:hypothetical protein